MIKKNIKLIVFVLILLVGFLIFLYLIERPYNYKKDYNVNQFKIQEMYDKNNNYYTFLVSYNNLNYPFVVKNDYTRKRALIDDVLLFQNDSEICLIPKSSYMDFYPLCSDNENIYVYNLSEIDNVSYKYNFNNVDKEYKNIKINYLDNLSYLVYNYKGFYLINKDNQKEIILFNKDVYNLELFYQINNYLIVPDYNQNYYFDNLYFINMENGKVEDIKLKNSISFDSVFLGDYKDKVYLLDKKEEKEYEINIKKKKVNNVDISILENKKMVKKDYQDVVTKNLNFLEENVIKFEVINNTLYEIINDVKIKVTSKDVTRIVKTNFDTVYYISDDSLYMYDNIKGEVLLLTNFEWNFNNLNTVFIEDNYNN